MSNKYTYEFVKDQIEKTGYKLLSTKYVGSNDKLSLKCPKGHEWECTFNAFNNRGRRCSICSGNKKLTISTCKKYIESFGYKLLSNEYINAHEYLKLQCDKGHEYNVRWNNFKKGHRCPVCLKWTKTSKAEIEIQKFVKSLTKNVINNDRNTILNPSTNYYLELDVYLPYLNKAIEYNGRYWHTGEDRIKCDIIKQNECNRLNIDLLVIHEQDYINNKEIELNKIKDFINEI